MNAMRGTMPVTKEFKTFEQQIHGLEARKLKFRNKKKSLETLQKYNYFDVINGFESILLNSGVTPKEYNGVYFEDFYDLFKFDMELKRQTLYKVFDIESQLRTSIAYHFASIHCSTIPTTMNYTKPCCYQAPSTTDTYLTKKFAHFDLFRTAQVDPRGRVTKPSYIDSLKKDKEYIKQYIEPPVWVVIKSLPLGSLYFTFLFLDNAVKSLVLQDFGFTISDTNIFEQSIYVLKEIRNDCAHLELVTRFKLKRNSKLNYFNDLTNFAGLSKTPLNYKDVVKVIKIFGNINDIKWIIFKFYFKMCIKGRKGIAKKILGKMGRKDIISWIKL